MTYVDDGTFDWSLGQNAWHNPDRIQSNQYASGVNLSTRGGTLSPRMGYHQKTLDFEDKTFTENYLTRTLKEIWESGKFQAAFPYVVGSENYIVSIISGLIFRYNIRTGKIILLSKTIKVDQYRPRINWSYADGKIVLYDWPDYPVIIEGEVVTRSSPEHKVNGSSAPQIPISFNGTYNQNRLFVSTLGNEITAGDPTGSKLTPEAPITFTEIFTPSSPFVNQSFSLPVEESSYPITAMGFLQELDSSTGIGPMFVATEKKVFFYNTNQPRANWEKGQFSGLLLSNVGIAGSRSFVNVNSDLIFMSGDGKIHALSTARNDAKKWANIPISREVHNYLKFWDTKLIQYAVLGYFDNFVFISANPYRVQALDRSQRPISDYAHGGFVVLELEAMASFLGAGAPVWDGIWTGINPMEIFNIDNRCFVISKDGKQPNGTNALYELLENETFDMVRGNKRRVKSILYTKSYNGGEGGEFSQKIENSIVLHVAKLGGKVDLLIEKRPTHSHEWLEVVRWKHEAPITCCELPEEGFFNGLSPHLFKQLMFGTGDDTGCNPITQENYESFREIQYRITIEADEWVLENLKLKYELQPYLERQDEDLCKPLPAKKLALECSPDWLIPGESICL